MSHLARVRTVAEARHHEGSQRDAAQLEEGTVVRVGDGQIVVKTEGGVHEAKRAKSCLVQPDVGDAVLVSFTGERRVFVLAVLEGAEDAGSNLVVHGDLDLRVEGGRLAVTSSGGVDVLTGGELALTGARLAARALEADVVVDKLAYVGTSVHAEVASIKSTGVTCDLSFDRKCERLKNSYRFVAETDALKAERIDHAAQEELVMRSRNCVVAAEELMKVDADQIQLG